MDYVVKKGAIFLKPLIGYKVERFLEGVVIKATPLISDDDQNLRVFK